MKTIFPLMLTFLVVLSIDRITCHTLSNSNRSDWLKFLKLINFWHTQIYLEDLEDRFIRNCISFDKGF